MKRTIPRKQLAAAMLGVCAAISFAPLQAKAEEIDIAPGQSSTSRYVTTSFGEALDTKYCVPEVGVLNTAAEVCMKHGFSYVTPEILASIAYQESKFVEDATNGTALGMCQIKGEFHQAEMAMVGATDLLNMEDALATCGAILDSKALEYAGAGFDNSSALAAAITHYHLNQDTAKRYVAEGKIDGYTAGVLDRAQRISLNRSVESALITSDSMLNPEETPLAGLDEEFVD